MRINSAYERSLEPILFSAPFAHSRHTTKYGLPQTPYPASEASSDTFLGESETSHDQANSAENHATGMPLVVIDLEDVFEGKKFQHCRKRQPEAEMLQPSPRPSKKRARRPDIRSVPVRDLPIAAPPKLLDTFTFDNVKVNAKATLELRDGHFIKVVKIFQNMETLEVNLLGWIFRPTRMMNNMLESQFNEVCWLLHLDMNDTRDVGVQGMESVSVSEVVKRRRIRLTNRPYPECTNEGVLVCRYKYICYYPDAGARNRLEWCEKTLERVSTDDCNDGYSTLQEILRHHWRGDTTKGGGCNSLVAGELQFLRNARQHRYVDESLGTRKTRRSSSFAPHRAQHQNEIRRRSVTSLIMELDLAQAPKVTISGKADQLEIQEISKSEFVHAAKSPGISMHTSQAPKRTFVDLTLVDDDQEERLRSLFDRARSAHSKRTGFHDNSSCYRSPEVVEVRAQIDTSSKLGTMRKEYQGQVTSTYHPTRSNTLKASPELYTVISELSRANSNYTMTSSRFKKSDEKFGRPVSLAADTRPCPTPVSLDISRLSSIVGQRYTFGDCFCGAGGTSRGAVDAGLRVQWGFDSNHAACTSYRLNYIGADIYHVDACRFSGLADKDHKVDICHLSPPCQYFSNAHTVDGKDDEKNIASLFAVSELLNQAKPRVATLEQTDGLLLRHPIFFNKVINMFTTLGFSIRWRVINCADFGLPQRRNRVFLIASW